MLTLTNRYTFMIVYRWKSMAELFVEDIVQRCNRTFVHIGGDFILIKDSPLHCPFLRVKNWREAWMALYLRRLVFGQFTNDRKIVDSKKYVPFGATEIIMEAMQKQMLDAAVVACDGAGTVITDRPDIVQGIGGRMSGLMYTTPRTSVIQRLQNKKATVLDPKTACIDAVRGAQKALETYERVAVTVTASQDIVTLKNLSKDIAIFVVHTTGITPEQAEYTTKADLVWGCASVNVPKIAGPRSLVQLGVAIPVFVLTRKGVNLVVPRIHELSPKTGGILEKKKEAIFSGTSYVIHHKRTLNSIDLIMEQYRLPFMKRGPHPLL
jgi:putative methanogenesis marker protein 8